MLEDAAERANACERVSEATVVLAALVAPPRLDEPREATPSRAGGVSDNGRRAGVRARVALLAPHVHVVGARVRAVRIREEDRNGHRFALIFAPSPTRVTVTSVWPSGSASSRADSAASIGNHRAARK